MTARLKVYQASLDGVNEWIVAAPNQRGALEAWGVHRNLFADGEADVTDEPAAQAAALAKPGVAMRRPKGGKGAFVAEGHDVSGWAAAAKAVGARKVTARKSRPVDRSKLDAAEAALDRFEHEAKARLDDLERQQAALDRERADARAEAEPRRRKLQAAVETARAALSSR